MNSAAHKKTRYPNKKCPHNRDQYYCRECGGRGLCEHNRQRNKCKDCHGSYICKHQLQKNWCIECHPCPHGALSPKCRECRKIRYDKQRLNDVKEVNVLKGPPKPPPRKKRKTDTESVVTMMVPNVVEEAASPAVKPQGYFEPQEYVEAPEVPEAREAHEVHHRFEAGEALEQLAKVTSVFTAHLNRKYESVLDECLNAVHEEFVMNVWNDDDAT